MFTTSVDVDGNGRYRSDAFRPRVPGAYRWVASYSGDDGNEAVRTSCDDEDERVVVKKKKPYGGKPRPSPVPPGEHPHRPQGHPA
ncbi:hypothetical protein [Catellatospora sp. NPDC049133]|uniref:hypothetical protein n=1 Tax=Catellatospora sp. NPDC049133 TaxID=3155499 RepID=UPI0033CE710B